MTRSPAGSTSSTDADPGAEIAGFRVERKIGDGAYEATQVALDRRVLLRLVAPEEGERFDRLEWFEHPNALRVYAAGSTPQHRYVATQLVDGATLAEWRPRRSEAVAILAGVAAALDAAHDSGLVHGAVEAENVHVADGRGFLGDFGLGPEGATPEDDRDGFARLVEETLRKPAQAEGATASEILRRAAPATRARGRWPWLVAPVALGAVAAIVLAGGDSDEEPERPPAVAAGQRPLGSALKATGVSSVDCEGQQPSGSSQLCTLLQTRLGARTVRAPEDGAIRRWVVRGARGQLALQVLRRRGREFDWIVRGPFRKVPDEGVHTFPASLPLRKGDEVAVVVTPGAAVGVRRGTPGATTARWLGPLRLAISTKRLLERGAGTGFDHEVLVRVDYEPGAKATLRGYTAGPAARRLPAGRPIDSQDVQLGDVTRTFAVVRLANRIAVDLLDGRRRLARLVLFDIDPRGSFLGLDSFGNPDLRLRWRNPDGLVVSHDYVIRPGTIEPRS